MEHHSNTWIDAHRRAASSYRKMVDRAFQQLTDQELHQRPAESINSVAVILQHLAGNLTSRWSDFLTTDGEKEWRNRDREFEDWDGSREELIRYFDDGWQKLIDALDESASLDPNTKIQIRGESQSLADAILRSLTHVSYHVGQMMLLARMVHQGEWDWLTIPPGKSENFNQQNWGSSASRGVMGEE